MLEELHVRGVGVIEEALLEFAPGLNVLSGETGAGKTLVTVALSLALGARAGSDMVGDASASAAVEARFCVDPDFPAWSDWADGQDLVLARHVRRDGRGSARAGGHLVPASALGALAGSLVEVHGQHQAERLLDPDAQTDFLDRFAGAAHLGAVAEYRAAYSAHRAARGKLLALDSDAREREREKDLLAYQIRELEAAALEPGEGARLASEESRLAHAARILELTGVAEEALSAEGSATDRLREAAGALDTVAALDEESEELASRLRPLALETSDLADSLRAYRDRLDVDPARLSSVRERIQALRGLERKYGAGEEGVLEYLEEARVRLAALESADDERSTLELEVEALGARARALAEDVGVGRAAAAPALTRKLTAELQELGMAGAGVAVDLDGLDELGPHGGERARFAFSGGPRQGPRPLSRVASGGELSRTMLACRSVLADMDDVPTLVFDEVDAGIGGRAAAAVGRRLAALSSRRQVLVVTHLAQIAVHADRHFLVTKEGGAASIRNLDGEERAEELARMLSGGVTSASMAHARDLLAGAGAAAQ